MTHPPASGLGCPVCEGRLGARPAFRLGRWCVVTCTACGHGLTDPRPSPEELQALYDRDAYYGERGMEAPEDLTPHHALLDGLLPWLPGPSLLDVGAGTGGLLAAASQRGLRVTGTEYSREAAGHAAERFGLPLRVGAFGEGQFGRDERFHGVTFIHVLEHLPDPAAALRLARRLLEPGGTVYVVVPNRASVAARFVPREAHRTYDLPYHLHHFTPESLERMIGAAGLDLVELWPSLPESARRVLGWAAAAKRRMRRTPDPLALGGDGAARPPDGAREGRPEGAGLATPPRASVGARLVGWLRAVLPGGTITAIARAPR